MGNRKYSGKLALMASTSVALALAAGSMPAAAQGTDQDAASGIEEIVVTARKREESLQDVPISITAFSANDLEMRSLNSLSDVGQFAPNLSFFAHGQTGKTSALVYIRGVGQTDPVITNDPGVGVYVDEVYMGRMQAIDLDLMDLERVEVLRGPQGTLFGRNTVGGALNIVTAKPSGEFGGEVQLTTGRYSRIDGKLSVNLPLVEDKLAIKIAASTRNSDGYGRQLGTGNEMGDTNRLSGRAMVLWTPSDDVEVLFSIDGTRVREAGPVRAVTEFGEPMGVFLLNMFMPVPYGPAFATDSPFTSYATDPNTNNLDAGGGSLAVTWDNGDWQFKSITSYRSFDALNGVDPDGSPYAIIDQTDAVEQQQFSQELRFSGEAADGRLNWVFGGYYFWEKADMITPVIVFGELYPIIGLDLSFTWDVDNKSKSYATFGQASYNLTDKLSLTAGLRYTDEDRTASRTVLAQVRGITLTPTETKSVGWNALSPRAGLEYRWSEDFMTYVSAARGFRSGGMNGRSSIAEDFLPYDPEYLWTYEAGFKAEFADRSVRLNATAFYSDYKDIQFTIVAGTVNAQPLIVVDNAAKATVKGFEAELVLAPTAGLLLNAGIGYINAKFDETAPGAPITTDSKFQKTPEWSLVLGGQYSAPVGDFGNIVARIDYSYKSSIHHDAANSPFAVQEGYGVANARLAFEHASNAWELALFVTNLGNKEYIVGATDFLISLGFAEVQYARPREWGLSLSYHF